jgi:hypothetical protein
MRRPSSPSYPFYSVDFTPIGFLEVVIHPNDDLVSNASSSSSSSSLSGQRRKFSCVCLFNIVFQHLLWFFVLANWQDWFLCVKNKIANTNLVANQLVINQLSRRVSSLCRYLLKNFSQGAVKYSALKYRRLYLLLILRSRVYIQCYRYAFPSLRVYVA